MKRLNLIAARIQAGFESQNEFVTSLRKQGFSISVYEYSDMESGRKKNIELGKALEIAAKLNKTKEISTLFLPIKTYKIRRSQADRRKTG